MKTELQWRQDAGGKKGRKVASWQAPSTPSAARGLQPCFNWLSPRHLPVRGKGATPGEEDVSAKPTHPLATETSKEKEATL